MKIFKHISVLLLLVAVFLSACDTGLTTFSESDSFEATKGEMIFFNSETEQKIKINTNYGYVIAKVDSTFADVTIKKNGAELLGSMEINGYRYLYLYKSEEIMNFLNTLTQADGVLFAEPDLINKLHTEVEYDGDLDDPRINSSQYAYHLTGLGDALKTYGVGEHEIYIATVDSGINKLHEEFSGIFSPGHSGFSMFNKTGTEGAVDYTFVGADAVPVVMDDTNWDSNPGEGHGTHVSGTILAKGNNGIGITGVCPDNAKYLFYKCFADDADGNRVEGSGSSWAVYGSLKYLVDWKIANLPADNSVPVNMSLGGDWASHFAIDMISYGLKNNVVIIASSGNDGFNVSSFPAAYQGVIAVGATNGRDEKVPFSNSGKYLSVTAPGFNIISTGNINGAESDKYTYKSGTSMSAPFVTGLVGLMLTHDPTLTPREIKQLLEENADDKGIAGFDEDYGWGRVNVDRTIGAVKNHLITPGTPIYSEFQLQAKVLNKGVGASKVPVYLYKSSGEFVATALTSDAGFASFGLLPEGEYELKVFFFGKDLIDGSKANKTVSFTSVTEDKVVEFNYNVTVMNIITAANGGTVNTDTIISIYLVDDSDPAEEVYTLLTEFDSDDLDKITFPMDSGHDYIIGINAYKNDGVNLDGHYALRVSSDDPASDTYTGQAALADGNDTLGEPGNNDPGGAYVINGGVTYNAYLDEDEYDYYRISIP